MNYILLRLVGDPVEIGMEIAIASFDSISEVNMVSFIVAVTT